MEGTLRLRFGGREDFKSPDRALVMACSCGGGGIEGCETDEVGRLGMDFDGIWPLGGLIGNGGTTGADFGGDNGALLLFEARMDDGNGGGGIFVGFGVAARVGMGGE
jgi:hypothetical protein